MICWKIVVRYDVHLADGWENKTLWWCVVAVFADGSKELRAEFVHQDDAISFAAWKNKELEVIL